MNLPRGAGRTALLCCAALLTVGITRWLLVQGLFLPVRVAGGSMAPSFLGAHWERLCESCGYRFSFGTEFPPDEVGVVCSNCGAISQDITATSRRRGGQRVLIDRLSLFFRAPRRWEVIAFRRHDGQRVVKRVVGLPTEKVALRDGDIYVGGRIMRKPWRITQAQSVSVHRDRCRGGQPRWRPETVTSKWRAGDEGYRYGADGDHAAGEFDYLVYHHLACLPPPTGNSPAAVLDSYGYNQSLSRRLFRVTDLMLEASVTWHGSGAINLRMLSGADLYELFWRPGVGRIELRCGDDGLLQTCASATVANDRTAQIAFAFVDKQVRFVMDGKTVLRHNITNGGAEHARCDALLAQSPLAIGAQGFSSFDFHESRVARDVYYVGAPGAASSWQLGDDEFLALGDNSPISQDARQGREFGIVTLDRIIGRVAPQHGRWAND